MLNIETKIMTENDCYKDGRTMTPRGITIHSTAEPGIRARMWYDMWNKPADEQNGREVCVHAFMDDEVVMQYLPWNHRGWHAGGRDNDDHIGIEICEPADVCYESDFDIVNYDVAHYRPYFEKVYADAVNLCVYLMRQFPTIRVEEIISHDEGWRRGTASAHHDPEHWWRFHGKDMNDFRADVRKPLGEDA